MKILPLKLCSKSLLVLSVAACGSDADEASPLPANAPDAVSNYADIVYASYQDSLSAARELDADITALVDTPSAEALTDARAAWRAAREPYLQTEVYRFYDGPIDNPEDGPEGLLNAWPLDENWIDYVADLPDAGIVNDTNLPITFETLESENELDGEKNIATGYHALEFLLWGQDTDPNGPGDRPFTDYVTGGAGTARNQVRRGLYLTTASELLISHLQLLVDAWAPNTPGNYRASFEAEAPAETLGRILSGMIILSGFETGRERLTAAMDSGDQEEEHSCFSDNTHRDMVQDVRGVQNVWLGRYARLEGGVVSGLSVWDIIAAKDAALATRVTQQIAESLSAAEALQPPFDREIAPGNAQGNARVETLIAALFNQRDLLEQAFEVYGLTRIPDPE